jgi:hypothetical protein
MPSPSISKKRPPTPTLNWHNDPIPQYVLTLAGVLQFSTRGMCWLQRATLVPVTNGVW